MSDDLKTAEQRGYSKGYAAGRRRKHKDISADSRRHEQQAFLDRAYLALLPAAMQVQGWTLDGEKVTTGKQRVHLASIGHVKH